MKKNCFFCKKTYTLDRSDPQYMKLSKNPKASYVCKSCNRSMQQDAQTSTGLNPDMIDSHDKFIR